LLGFGEGWVWGSGVGLCGGVESEGFFGFGAGSWGEAGGRGYGESTVVGWEEGGGVGHCGVEVVVDGRVVLIGFGRV